MQTNAMLCLSIMLLLLGAESCAAAQKPRHQITGEVAKTAKEAPITAKRSLFTGTESRVAELGWIGPDCSTSSPDIRVVKQPAHGEVRFEQAKTVVSGDKTALQKQCHGKPLEALNVYYKAKADYTGGDAFTIDVDTKLGSVKRYVFDMDIR